MVRYIARLGAVVALAVSFFHPAPASAALAFNITNQGAASAQMMTGVAQAATLWSAFIDSPITINVRVNAVALPVGQIGSTGAFFDSFSYAAVRQALVDHRTSISDISSTNHLQTGPMFSMLINRTANDPAGVVSATPYFDTGRGGPGQAGPENNSNIRMSAANAKVLGLVPYDPTLLDATINFSTLQSFDFDRSNGINANQVDFVGVAAHEIGHMLGFLSGVDTLDGNGNAPGLNDNQLKFVTPLDLFRFSTRSIGPGGGDGVIDWTVDNTTKYLSVDGGATAIAAFSNGTTFGDGAGAGHWKDNLGLGLMDPSAALGEQLLITSNDLRALDVIGYHLNDQVPEPSTLMLLVAAGLWSLRRRWRRCSHIDKPSMA
jgi:hypothetical protein